MVTKQKSDSLFLKKNSNSDANNHKVNYVQLFRGYELNPSRINKLIAKLLCRSLIAHHISAGKKRM